MKCPNYQQEKSEPAVSYCGLGKFYCGESPDAPLFDRAIRTVIDAQATGRQAQDDLLKLTKACDYLTSQCSDSIEAPENQKYVQYTMQKRHDLTMKMEQSLRVIKDAQAILRRGAEFYQHRTQHGGDSGLSAFSTSNFSVTSTYQNQCSYSSSAVEIATGPFLSSDSSNVVSPPATLPSLLGSQQQSLRQNPVMLYSTMAPSLEHYAAKMKFPTAMQALIFSERAEASCRTLSDAENREEYQPQRSQSCSMKSPGRLPKKRTRLDRSRAQDGPEERGESVRRSARVKNKIINYAESASSLSSPERSPEKTGTQRDSPYKPERSQDQEATRLHRGQQFQRAIPAPSLSEKIIDFKRRVPTSSQATSAHFQASRLQQSMLPNVISQPQAMISPNVRGHAIKPGFQAPPSHYQSAISSPLEGPRLLASASNRVAQVQPIPALSIGSFHHRNESINKFETEPQNQHIPLSTHFVKSQDIPEHSSSHIQKSRNDPQERAAIAEPDANNMLHTKMASFVSGNDDDVFTMEESQGTITKRNGIANSEIHRKENLLSLGRPSSEYDQMRKSIGSTAPLPILLAHAPPPLMPNEPTKRTLPASSPITQSNRRPRLSMPGERPNATQQNLFTAYASRDFTMSSPPTLSFCNTEARAISKDDGDILIAPAPVFAPKANMNHSIIPSQAYINRDHMGMTTQSLLQYPSATSMPWDVRSRSNATPQALALSAYAYDNQQEEAVEAEVGEHVRSGQLQPRIVIASIDNYKNEQINMNHTSQHTGSIENNPTTFRSLPAIDDVEQVTGLPILPEDSTGNMTLNDPDLPSAAYLPSDIDCSGSNDIITGGH